MKIYLASAVTNASDKFKVFIENFRKDLKKDFEVLDYFGLRPGDAKEVFEYNRKCINKSDLILAECSEQSLGTGYEIAYGLSIGKKVIAVAKERAKVGRMITGITNPNYSFVTYKNIDEVLQTIRRLT